MKRIIALLLATVLLLGMAACGANKEEPRVEYVPSEDIEIAVTYVDEMAKVVTRRTSDKKMTGIVLACVYFDELGTLLRAFEQIECTFSSDNALSVWSFTPPIGCTYVEAVIDSVIYADGTTKVCSGVSTWAEDIAANFTVAAKEKQFADMVAKEAEEAKKCDAVTYKTEVLTDGTMELTLENKSGKDIEKAVFYMLWFDKNGAPIDMDGVLVSNSETVSAKQLKAEETTTYIVSVPEGAASVKTIVQTINFADETTWTNDLVYEWAVANQPAVE